MAQFQHVTQLLNRWNQGEQQALDVLFEELYPDLKIIARSISAPLKNTQPTILVNEVYLKLVTSTRKNREWNDRREFFQMVKKAMLWCLIDKNRKEKAEMRGGRLDAVTFSEEVTTALAESDPTYHLALDQVLKRLAKHMPEHYEVVSLRFLDDEPLTPEQVSKRLKIAERTVYRYTKEARIWMSQRLG